MTKEQIFELMSKNPGFHLATIDGTMPRVRGMLLFRADDNGIIFHTGTFKDVYRQIVACPNVELCFNDYEQNAQVRVSGSLEIIDDIALKEEISSHPTRVFLQGWKQSVPLEDFYNSFMVFRLKGGKAVVWTFETNLAPKVEIAL